MDLDAEFIKFRKRLDALETVMKDIQPLIPVLEQLAPVLQDLLAQVGTKGKPEPPEQPPPEPPPPPPAEQPPAQQPQS